MYLGTTNLYWGSQSGLLSYLNSGCGGEPPFGKTVFQMSQKNYSPTFCVIDLFYDRNVHTSLITNTHTHTCPYFYLHAQKGNPARRCLCVLFFRAAHIHIESTKRVLSKTVTVFNRHTSEELNNEATNICMALDCKNDVLGDPL